jgi:hypothetical protein
VHDQHQREHTEQRDRFEALDRIVTELSVRLNFS